MAIMTVQQNSFSTLVLYCCLTLGFCQFAENLDSYLDKIKLNVAGETRPRTMDTIGMEMSKSVGKMITGAAFHPVRTARDVMGATNAPRQLSRQLDQRLQLGDKAKDAVKTAAPVAWKTAKTVAPPTVKAGMETAEQAAKGAKAAADVAKTAASSAKTVADGAKNAAKAKAEGVLGISNLAAEGIKAATGDSDAMKGAVSSAIKGAALTVTGAAKDGNFSMTGNGSGGFQVSKDAGNHSSLASALDTFGGVAANLTGENGTSYSVNKGSKGGFSGSFQTSNGVSGKMDLSGMKSWSDVTGAISNVAGGISSVASFSDGNGKSFGTKGADGGGVSVQQNIGNYGSGGEAISAMKNLGVSAFNVQNAAGYQSAANANTVLGKMEFASGTDIMFNLASGGQAGTMHSDQSVTMNDGSKHESLASAAKSYGASSVSLRNRQSTSA